MRPQEGGLEYLVEVVYDTMRCFHGTKMISVAESVVAVQQASVTMRWQYGDLTQQHILYPQQRVVTFVRSIGKRSPGTSRGARRRLLQKANGAQQYVNILSADSNAVWRQDVYLEQHHPVIIAALYMRFWLQ